MPAIVPLEFCFSGVISGVGVVFEESWAVGGGWVGGGVEVEVDVVLDAGFGFGVGVIVVDERVISVVGRDVLDEDASDFSGRLVDRDDEMSDVGLAVYPDVGLSLSLRVVGLRPGLDVEVVIWSIEFEGDGREVGLVVSALLVANKSCVTTLNPASIDDATSTGSAASSTERAFSGSSCRLEPDMASFEPPDGVVAKPSISEAAWSMATTM